MNGPFPLVIYAAILLLTGVKIYKEKENRTSDRN
jgi:hypothetical protein